MIKIKAFETISQNSRNPAIDFFRAIAIISVVLCHFNRLFPYGELGVDLFFIISGFLIGGLLNKKLMTGESIYFFRFFLQRSFKILPSFYVFMFLGNLIVYLFYSNISPEEFIPLWDLPRYLFFYQNYTGGLSHPSFYHIWSLCVEEHFYILLPILFIIVQRYFNLKFLFSTLFLVVILGTVFRYISFKYTSSHETYAGTHNRVDALAWGVLMSLFFAYYPQGFLVKNGKWILLMGIILFLSAIFIDITVVSEIYRNVVLHTLIPFSFFLIIAGSYQFKFEKLKFLRIISYYSYNWYLWHFIFVTGVTYLLGNNALSAIVFVVFTFIISVVFTILIEEPFLNLRSKYRISKI
jgi:peptidoglycan/LPS O-acetylase OafA/YrhL